MVIQTGHLILLRIVVLLSPRRRTVVLRSLDRQSPDTSG